MIKFNNRVLLLGCGAVSQCLQPLLLDNMEMDFSKLTIMDFEDNRGKATKLLERGASYVQDRITPDNLSDTLAKYLSSGDMLIDLAWNIDGIQIMTWCNENNVLYINASLELWDPYDTNVPPTERTLYHRHMALRSVREKFKGGPTAIIDHGANPGLVSHWTKMALEDITKTLINSDRDLGDRRDKLQQSLNDQNFPQLAMLTGTKVIHISERDSQITNKPKLVDEFVNTWSVAGFHEEGIAPAEMGWGTHERKLPKGAQVHKYGPGNQICLSRSGINTYVRSWVPSGEIMGMVIRHGEAFSISNYLTVWDGDKPIYRPTVHYAYMPCDCALNSLYELKMRGCELQSKVRILNDEISDGKDELGVLLMGHDLNAWWTGSLLDIHETRNLVEHQNATTLQVAAALLGAIDWMVRNPNQGLNVPDDLPFREILEVANPYLGKIISEQSDWSPLNKRFEPFAKWGNPVPGEDDKWQFDTFLVK
jgi:homospermidine synthase